MASHADIVDLEDAPDDAVAAIYRGDLLGVRVVGAWSPQECAAADAALDEAPMRRHRIHANAPLLTYGKMLAPSALEPLGPSLDDYFEEAVRDAEVLETLFGGHFLSKLSALLSRAAGGRPARVLDRPSPHRPATVRELGPGADASAHFDTYAEAPAFDHLHEHTDRAVQLSYYVQLRVPDGGGQLEVSAMHRQQGERAQRAPRDVVPLATGDLIVFDGANHWHQVTEVRGKRARITVGGFAALSSDHRELYFWG